jgi:hypothetical protein
MSQPCNFGWLVVTMITQVTLSFLLVIQPLQFWQNLANWWLITVYPHPRNVGQLRIEKMGAQLNVPVALQ